MHRLKSKNIKKYREDLLKKQKGMCGLQNIKIEIDQAVLDHDHTTGHIRTVLSRNANSIEGRILSFIGRLKGSPDPIQFLKKLIQYWEYDYSNNPLHPTHKLPEEIQRLKLKRKLKKLKSKKFIDKTKQEIKDLNLKIKEFTEN